MDSTRDRLWWTVHALLEQYGLRTDRREPVGGRVMRAKRISTYGGP
ncbi:hypothetical protein [Halopiger djelfimassiliensis]|nr:hypothetical protein [Halopiger djelfimassiliensis]